MSLEIEQSAEGKDVVYGGAGGPGGPRFSSITHDILGDPFWDVYRRGLRDAAMRFGCQVHHRAPRQFSPQRMAELVEEARQQRPDGMLATIPDVEAVQAALRAAIDDGIPVIAVNAADPRPWAQRIPYLFYIGAEDVAGGRLAAERLFDRGPAHRGLAVDHYLVENACHSARCQGFVDALSEHGVPAEKLRVPGDDPTTTVQVIARYLSGRPDVDIVLTLGPPGCRAVIEALSQANAIGRVRHASFDLALDQLESIVAGELAFTIDSQQYLQGFLGVSFLYLHAAHGFVPAGDVNTGPAIVDASNVATAFAGVKAGVR